MSSMTFAQSKTQLNTLLSNTTGFTFNDDEVTQLLTDAWNDKYAVTPSVEDTTQTFDAHTPTYKYSIPTTLTTISSVNITRSSTDAPERVDDSLWSIVGSQIMFTDRALQVIPDGYTLYLRGRYKVTIADTVTNTGLQQYIIALAGYNSLRYLLLKKTMLFVKNDTSVSEIVGARRELYADVVHWRQQLTQEFMGV